MDDTTACPICSNRLRTIKTPNKFLHWVDKTANYIERICNKGMNHSLRIFTDEATGEVDMLKLSLNPRYSRFLEIDFVNQKCRINCMKEGKSDYIDIEKMITPDFPKLEKLKERVNLFVVFS